MGGETLRAMSTSTTTYPKLAAGPVGKQVWVTCTKSSVYLADVLLDPPYLPRALEAVHKLRTVRIKGFARVCCCARLYCGLNTITDCHACSKLYEGRACGEDCVKLSVYSPPDLSRPTFMEATSHEFKPTKVGECFGPSWATHWFRINLIVPSDLKDKGHLEFHWDANNEGLIWTEHGDPVHGLTGGGERTEWILPDGFRDGKEHVFYVEMACNGMFGNAEGDTIQPPPPDRSYKLKTADIVAVNLQARALYVDFLIIGGMAFVEMQSPRC